MNLKTPVLLFVFAQFVTIYSDSCKYGQELDQCLKNLEYCKCNHNLTTTTNNLNQANNNYTDLEQKCKDLEQENKNLTDGLATKAPYANSLQQQFDDLNATVTQLNTDIGNAIAFGIECRLRLNFSVEGTYGIGTYSWTEAVACENANATLDCTPGQSITPLQVTYGRTDSNTCLANQTVTDCFGNHSAAKATIESSCLGMPSCTQVANNTYFGDSCANVSKYIDAIYTCK